MSRERAAWWKLRGTAAPMAAAALIAWGCGARSSLQEELAGGGGASVVAPPGGGGGVSSPPQPDVVEETCRRYCERYTVECLEDLKGRDCLAECRQRISAACRQPELAVLDCLAPFFDDPNDPAETCGPATVRALAQCRSQLYEAEKCRAAETWP